MFANLYYEHNNDGLDFHQTSNLKCAVYADTHSAAEKTNFGGQQLEAPPAGLTFIQESSGFSSKTLVDPPTPDGYELVFGPTNGANNAPGVRINSDLAFHNLTDSSYSTWASLSSTGTTSTPAPNNATLAVPMAKAVPANTSTFGVQLSTEILLHILAAWYDRCI